MLFTWVLLAASAFSSFAEERARVPSVSEIHQELSHRLSDGTEIHFPFDTEYANYTTRWNEAVATYPTVVVVPATKEDVAITVKFANTISVPFYVVNRAHGSTITQLAFNHGIQINMRHLTRIEIADDGKSAVMGGGVWVDEIRRVLDAKGKATATGVCGCVGGMGPALGGGFGYYMGFYGLALDQIISLDVVFADGSTTEVSATSKPDLYWGMRGAGHNFGVVTQFKYKIYDRPTAKWYYTIMTFTPDKLEKFFELLNSQNAGGEQAKELVTYSLYAMNPAISTTEASLAHPLIFYSAYYAGTAAQAQPYLTPFLDLGPVAAVNETISFPDLADAVGTGSKSPVCQDGGSGTQFPVGLKTYNTTANRAVHSLYKKMIVEQPAFSRSIIQFENYPVQEMKSVDPASTAYPHRGDNLLVSLTMFYAKNPALDALVPVYGRQARALLNDGEPQRPLNAYINYAYGDETLEQMYGYEPWRLQKLRALKKKYDPENSFRFYNPIV